MCRDTINTVKECRNCSYISLGFLSEPSECGYFNEPYTWFVPSSGIPEWCPLKANAEKKVECIDIKEEEEDDEGDDAMIKMVKMKMKWKKKEEEKINKALTERVNALKKKSNFHIRMIGLLLKKF